MPKPARRHLAAVTALLTCTVLVGAAAGCTNGAATTGSPVATVGTSSPASSSGASSPASTTGSSMTVSPSPSNSRPASSPPPATPTTIASSTSASLTSVVPGTPRPTTTVASSTVRATSSRTPTGVTSTGKATTSVAGTSTPPRTTVPPSTTKVTATSSPPPATATVWVIGKAKVVPKTWTQQFLSPYGTATNRLGSAPGGDDGSLTLGPEYAAQGPDGTWYVLDAAKRRIARLGPTGTYLGAVAVPASLLAGGYFQYQLPRVLADGTLIAESQVGDLTRLLRVKGNTISGVMTSTAVVITADDGAVLYGFDMDNHPVAVNPATGAVTTTAWFRTSAGNRYRLTPAAGKITIAAA